VNFVGEQKRDFIVKFEQIQIYQQPEGEHQQRSFRYKQRRYKQTRHRTLIPTKLKSYIVSWYEYIQIILQQRFTSYTAIPNYIMRTSVTQMNSTGNVGSSSMINLSSVGSSTIANGNGSSSMNATTTTKTLRSESMAYPTSHVDTVRSKIQFYLRQNSKGVFCTVAFLLVIFIITSDAIHDMGRRTGSNTRPMGGLIGNLRGQSYSNYATTYQLEHWGGAMHPGMFFGEDAILTDKGASAGSATFRFATVTDLDQLSAVKESKKPEFRSLFVPGTLHRTGSDHYEITFETPRTLLTKHNEAGRGAEFSELTIYNNRLLTFDDRTGDIFEIINNSDGTDSEVVPRFVITEGEGDTDKGMKWEWATVKDDELYIGSMGKEYTKPDGSIANVNNLWIGILNGRGELRRENWMDKYAVVRKALGAQAPGYIIMEAILWSPYMKKWVFLPRRISSTKYDENEDEIMGGTKLVLVDEYFKKTEVVTIEMEKDPLRGFSSFAFVPGTHDRHAIAIRSVEENCTGDLDLCQQRSYFLVFDVTTGKVLSEEVKFKENMKFEGIEFVNAHAKPLF
jgi:soluble calcium-activated nucleotidase 1